MEFLLCDAEAMRERERERSNEEEHGCGINYLYSMLPHVLIELQIISQLQQSLPVHSLGIR